MNGVTIRITKRVAREALGGTVPKRWRRAIERRDKREARESRLRRRRLEQWGFLR